MRQELLLNGLRQELLLNGLWQELLLNGLRQELLLNGLRQELLLNGLSAYVPSGNTSLGLKWPARGIASRHMLRPFCGSSVV